MMPAALPGPDAVAVAFSQSGSTSAALDAIEMARRNGARGIAVTNDPDSPVPRVVDVVLCATVRNLPWPVENATAGIAPLNLLDALFVTVAQRDSKTADLNLGRTICAVQSKRRI